MAVRNTGCFDLLPADRAAVLTALFQVFTMIVEILSYLALESRGFIVSRTLFRTVIFTVGFIYVCGAVLSIIGVCRRQVLLVNIQATLTTTIMILTDALAISIIFLMAVGNRSTFLNSLPSRFVDEQRFYSALGPFWMYLGAITLHITVAINMAFLQSFNTYTKLLQKDGQLAKTALRNFSASQTFQ
ncbi:unnamed protein product [Caenorhabditis auriculariae]|uniref:Uncharacterized protein n=1 Tax=Caenorhabditis auriculariae TaxID=2777116 RepID=A0A8S1GPY9_9PELO|nr:unnamed protein product [Caenorhabditis auriculariae]